jgi:hypothetical protein
MIKKWELLASPPTTPIAPVSRCEKINKTASSTSLVGPSHYLYREDSVGRRTSSEI